MAAEWLAVRETYQEMDRSGSTSRTEHLDECRKIAYFVRDTESGKVRISANSCRLRWCPLCANTKKTFVAFNLKEWLATANYPKMVTLTMQHSNAPLGHQINHLYQSFRKLRKTKLFKRTVSGGVWFFQIKFNTTAQQWHPHIHALLTGKYIPHGLLSTLWLKITHTSHIVDIRPVRDFEKASFEVARYCARPSPVKDVPKEHRTELFASMHGRRLCGTWGTGRKLLLNQPREPNPGQWEYLGRWGTIRDNIETNLDAQQIYEAWIKNKPLPPNISLNELDNFIDGVPEEVEPEPPPAYLFKGF
jgi:hypothetical protein